MKQLPGLQEFPQEYISAVRDPPKMHLKISSSLLQEDLRIQNAIVMF